MIDRDIADLDPALQVLYREWAAQCAAARLLCRAIVTWRSPADQNAAKEQGLSNAVAGESPHGCIDASGKPAARAFDFGVFTGGGAYIKDGTDPRYRQAGEIGKGLGLVYGGDWIGFKDWDHLEMTDWKIGAQFPA